MRDWRHMIGQPSPIVVNHSSNFGIITGGKNSKVVFQSNKKTPPTRKRTRETCDKRVTSSNWRQRSWKKVYNGLNRDYMWTLPRGTIVEDVLYNGFSNESLEYLGHSFIIDINEDRYRRLFHPDDWISICEKVPQWPEKDGQLGEVMKKFIMLESTGELRRILHENNYPPAGEPYDRNKHYDGEWVYMVWRILLSLYEDPNQGLLKEHPEGWYNINIWSVVVDYCLRNLTGMNFLRDNLHVWKSKKEPLQTEFSQTTEDERSLRRATSGQSSK